MKVLFRYYMLPLFLFSFSNLSYIAVPKISSAIFWLILFLAIPDEDQERIFDPYYSTKPGGTGFGLWWSRTFLRRLGGDIELGKADGKGCAFRVLLPTSEAKTARNVDSPDCKL